MLKRVTGRQKRRVGVIQDQTEEKVNSIFAESIGMRYDGANNVLCGKRDGFDVILYESKGRYGMRRPYNFSALVSAARPTGEMFTAAEMQELENNLKKVDEWGFVAYCQQVGHDIIVPNLVATGVGGLPRTEDSAKKLDCLCSFLKNKGCRPCCSCCGQETEVSSFRVGERYQHLCPACEADTRSKLASQKQRRKENVVFGVAGALLGTLPGVAAIVWALQSEVMLPMVMIGAAMVLCILEGYDLLGGRLTRKAAVIGSVAMLPMIYVADRFEWAIQLYKNGAAARFKLNLWQCFMEVPSMISRNVIHVESYIERLVMVYLLLLLGAVPTFIYLFWGNQSREQFARLG